MMNVKTRLVNVDALRTLMEQLLAAIGCDAETAKTIANVHLEADLRGVSVQGLNHLINSHITDFRRGRIDPAGKPEIVTEGDAYALIEGNHGPGPIAAIYAAELAAAKAAKAGCAMVGVRNSDDLFIAGYYVDLIARQGMVGFLFSDDVVCRIHPLGGTEQAIGTNPMAIAVPTEGEPFVLDFAPTATLPTYVRYTRRYGRRLPEGVAQDVDGRPTTDPEAVPAADAPNQEHLGAINPLGNKGYGLLLAIDFLSGAFVGCDMGTDHRTKPGAIKGHFFMAANPAMFGGVDTFKSAVSARARLLKDSRKAPGCDEIRIPGERSFAARDRALRDGVVPIDLMCWEDTVKLAAELGVAIPD